MASTFFVQILIWIAFLNLPSTAGLHVKITGIKSNHGKIILGVFKNDGGFPEIGRQYKGYEMSIKNYCASITIKDLPKGTYAIGVCHDVNNNDSMDKNFLGIPLEPFGFSKNVRPYLKSPSFESVSFSYNGSLELEIKVESY